MGGCLAAISGEPITANMVVGGTAIPAGGELVRRG